MNDETVRSNKGKLIPASIIVPINLGKTVGIKILNASIKSK